MRASRHPLILGHLRPPAAPYPLSHTCGPHQINTGTHHVPPTHPTHTPVAPLHLLALVLVGSSVGRWATGPAQSCVGSHSGCVQGPQNLTAAQAGQQGQVQGPQTLNAGQARPGQEFISPVPQHACLMPAQPIRLMDATACTTRPERASPDPTVHPKPDRAPPDRAPRSAGQPASGGPHTPALVWRRGHKTKMKVDISFRPPIRSAHTVAHVPPIQ